VNNVLTDYKIKSLNRNKEYLLFKIDKDNDKYSLKFAPIQKDWIYTHIIEKENISIYGCLEKDGFIIFVYGDIPPLLFEISYKEMIEVENIEAKNRNDKALKKLDKETEKMFNIFTSSYEPNFHEYEYKDGVFKYVRFGRYKW
jgi:hypothetical protein